MAKADTDQLIGTIANRNWRITRTLGQGGAGVVYACKHVKTGQEAALKQLKTDWSDNEELLERFFQEVQILRRLRHPNIVEIYDVGFQEDLGFFLVMEYVPGTDLNTRIENSKEPLPWNELIAITAQICDGMAFAHSKGVIHRDLKPANIFLHLPPNAPPEVKILDFGIAKAMTSDDVRLTQTGTMVGSPAYLSPEQAMGEAVSNQSDIYSLSVILFEILTEQPLFEIENSFRYMMNHVYKPPRRLSEARPDLPFPKGLEDLIWDGLAKSQAERPQSMTEFKERLLAAIQEPPRAASAPAEKRPAASVRQPTQTRSTPTPSPNSGVYQHSGHTPKPAATQTSPLTPSPTNVSRQDSQSALPVAQSRQEPIHAPISSSALPSAQQLPMSSAKHTPTPKLPGIRSRSASTTGTTTSRTSLRTTSENQSISGRSRNSSAMWQDAQDEDEQKKRRTIVAVAFGIVVLILLFAALLVGK